MLRDLSDHLQFTKGLGFRLAALLSVAILPMGLMSLIQTLYLSGEAERSAQTAIIGRTGAAGAGERALLQSALGTADALGPAVLRTLDDPQACSEMMQGFIERGATYVYAGFVRMNGTTSCNSAGAVRDMRGQAAYQHFIANPTTMIVPMERGAISQRPVVVVGQPLYLDRQLLGYVAVSLSQDLLRSTHEYTLGVEGAQIATFNAAGEILSADGDFTHISELMPQGFSLADLVARAETSFAALSQNGSERVFSVVSVVPGLVYALGSYRTADAGFQGYRVTKLSAVLFPAALWLVSLAVAYFAVYRLVLRHVRELRGQMRRFAVGDRSSVPRVIQDAPAEIADVSRTFQNMVRILNRDEAALEEALVEKTVLLKEVHHRVKNNLQLIASIINMQGRVIEDQHARRVLRSVQDRVASMAAIYKNLYQAEHLDAVEADRLMEDIINQLSRTAMLPGDGLRIDTELSPLMLLPDQAVPLTLLTTEAVTNALKYAGVPPGEDHRRVQVSLTLLPENRARLRVVNSIGPGDDQKQGTGLGSQLIEAFAMQLESEIVVERTDAEYALTLEFTIDQIDRSPPEESRAVVLTSAARRGARH